MPKASQLSCNFHITLLHILWSSSTTNTLHTKSNDTNEHPSVKSHLASWTACWASTSRHHSQKTLLQTIAREQCSEQCTVHLTRNKSSVLEQTFSARLDPRLPRSFHSTRLGGALACRTSPNSFDARRRQKARVCTSSRWNLNIKTTVIFKMQASLWTAPHFTFVPQMLPTVYRKSVR